MLRELKRNFVGIEDHFERFSARNCPSVIQPPDSISRVIAAEGSSKVTNTTDFPTGPHRWRMALDKHVLCLEFLQKSMNCLITTKMYDTMNYDVQDIFSH